MTQASTIERDGVKTQLAARHPHLLLDVLPPEFFKKGHIADAQNACVYQVDFLDRVRELAPDPGAMIIVYGSGARNLASATAADKLIAAGYRNVHDYRGGLDDWKAGGGPIDGESDGGDASSATGTPPDGMLAIDLEASRVEWTGRSLVSAHRGALTLISGGIELRNGSLTGGHVIIDMRSMANDDIEDPAMRDLLIDHLQSDDFFDVEHYPRAEFRLTGATPTNGATPGSANATVTGELTIKGVVQSITFPAAMGPTPDGRFAAEAHFDIDRTRWNVLYGSGKFYEKLGKHLVQDAITIGLKLVTHASGGTSGLK